MSALQASLSQHAIPGKPAFPHTPSSNTVAISQTENADSVQRQLGNQRAHQFMPPNPNGSPPSTPKQSPDQFLAQRAALNSSHSLPSFAPQSSASIFFTPATPSPRLPSPRPITRIAPSGQVQRRFSGALGKMTDDEIFDDIRLRHTNVPTRFKSQITFLRNSKSKTYSSMEQLEERLNPGQYATKPPEPEREPEPKESKNQRRKRLERQRKMIEQFLQSLPKRRIAPPQEDLTELLNLIEKNRQLRSGQTGEKPVGEESTEKPEVGPDLDNSKILFKVISDILGDDWYMKEGLGLGETVDRSNLFEQGREKKSMISDSGLAPSTYGMLTAVTTPTFGEPVKDKEVFSTSPGKYLEATIEGRRYWLQAGQNYLNTKVSESYKSDEKSIRDGGVKLLRTLQKEENIGQPEVRFVRDGHHRLIWAAFFHKQAIKVELSEGMGQVPFGQKPPTWAEMLYKDDPTKEKKEAPPTKELKHKIAREWISQEMPFSRYARLALQQQDPFTAFVISACEYHKYECSEEAITEIANHIRMILPDRTKTFFEPFVANLVARAKNKETASKIQQFLKEEIPSRTTKTLSIFLGPTESVGFYDTTLHTITLDPVKNPDADALLDTLSFEIQNAVSRTKLALANKTEDKVERGKKVVDVEFDSDDKYVKSLITIHGANDIDDLVRNKLQVPSQFLVKAVYKSVKEGTGKVEMPDRSVLPRQNAREALWFWKTAEWTPEQRKEIWGGTEHAEGMGASTSAYGTENKHNKDKNEKGKDDKDK